MNLTHRVGLIAGVAYCTVPCPAAGSSVLRLAVGRPQSERSEDEDVPPVVPRGFCVEAGLPRVGLGPTRGGQRARNGCQLVGPRCRESPLPVVGDELLGTDGFQSRLAGMFRAAGALLG